MSLRKLATLSNSTYLLGAVVMVLTVAVATSPWWTKPKPDRCVESVRSYRGDPGSGNFDTECEPGGVVSWSKESFLHKDEREDRIMVVCHCSDAAIATDSATDAGVDASVD